MFGRLMNLAKVAGALTGVSITRCKAEAAVDQASPAWSRAVPQWICASKHPMFFEVVKQVVPGGVTTIHTKGWYPQLSPFCISQARIQMKESSFDASEYQHLPLLALVTYKSSFTDLWNNIQYCYTGSLITKTPFYEHKTIPSALVFIRDEEEQLSNEHLQELIQMCEDAKTCNVSLSIVILVR